MAASALGRPSSYDPQVGDSICVRLESGESLLKICSDEGFPDRSTVFRWLAKHEDFRANYARARIIQAEVMIDEITAIADSATAEDYNPARLRVETRKWIASKVLPKVYGDAMQLRHADADGNKMQVEVTRVAPRQQRVIDVTPAAAGARRRLPAAADQVGVAGGIASEGAD
jgi:hypothetical protein